MLDSDITDTDLKAAAATCVFGDELTPFCVVTEYTLGNLVNRQRGQLNILTFFPGPSFRERLVWTLTEERKRERNWRTENI